MIPFRCKPLLDVKQSRLTEREEEMEKKGGCRKTRQPVRRWLKERGSVRLRAGKKDRGTVRTKWQGEKKLILFRDYGQGTTFYWRRRIWNKGVNYKREIRGKKWEKNSSKRINGKTCNFTHRSLICWMAALSRAWWKNRATTVNLWMLLLFSWIHRNCWLDDWLQHWWIPLFFFSPTY